MKREKNQKKENRSKLIESHFPNYPNRLKTRYNISAVHLHQLPLISTKKIPFLVKQKNPKAQCQTSWLLINRFDIVLISHIQNRIRYWKLILRWINTLSHKRLGICSDYKRTPTDFVPKFRRIPFYRRHTIPFD